MKIGLFTFVVVVFHVVDVGCGVDKEVGWRHPVWIRHPEDIAIAINFQPPECIAGQATVFQCRVFGLVRGARYKVEATVQRGTIIVFQDEWLLRNAVFNTTIPPLSLSEHTVRISVFDYYLGLDLDESFLSSMIRDMEMYSIPGGDNPVQVASMMHYLPSTHHTMRGSVLDEGDGSEVRASWKGFLHTDNTEGQDGKQVLAICSCVTSKPGTVNDGTIVDFPRELKQTALQMMMIPSIERTITPDERKKFHVRLYLGIDDTDAFWLDQVARLQAPSGW